MSLGMSSGVTAIMPSWNQGRWIRRSMQSLTTDPAVAEVLVMDRHSTDATAAILHDYPRTRLVTRDRTVQDAIWDGIERARTEWVIVAFTSDWFEPRAVSILLAHAQRWPEVASVGAGTIVHEITGQRRLKLCAPGWLSIDDVINDGQAPGITLFRRSIALHVGWQNLHDDHSLYTAYLLRALTTGWAARRLARPLINFRRHANSLSGNEAHGIAVHEEVANYRHMLANQYRDVLTPVQCARLRQWPTGHERPLRRARRRVARWWYAPRQEATQ